MPDRHTHYKPAQLPPLKRHKPTPDMSDTSFFDDFGRCIPTRATSAVHTKTRRYFICQQPVIDYAEIHARLVKHLGAGLEISPDEFAERARAIHARLEADPQTRNINRGVGIPFILPRTRVPDIGALLDERYLPAVGRAFQEKFPDYSFTNHHQTGLTGRLSILPGSRHQKLLDAMSERDVVGVYFPAFSEYSIPAAVEQLAALPDNFLLSGGFDTAAALVAAPDLLLRTDGYPPLLWLGALASEKEGIGYQFEAYGYNLAFNRRPHLGQAAEYWANGITLLEQS